VYGRIQTRLVLGQITLDGSGHPTGELEEVGELQALLADGVIPAVQEGDLIFAETILILGTVEV